MRRRRERIVISSNFRVCRRVIFYKSQLVSLVLADLKNTIIIYIFFI